jgi:hypothetical protein
MKNIIALATILFSSSILAANVEWSDMEVGKNYHLTQDIVFETGATYKSGESFDMTDFTMGDVPVMYYQMTATECKDPSQTAPMILVDANDVILGVELSEGCTLDVFIEPQDYYKDSVFTE